MTNIKKSIATIITCHNRKEKTLTCLSNLMKQDAINAIDLSVYLVDDGSKDGTGDAVKQNFPQVIVLQGNGTLYWNGGMRLAFSEAMKSDCDYYLWLNDDTFLYSNALNVLLETSDVMKKQDGRDIIATGSIIDIDTEKVNYGGRNIKSKFQPLNFLQLKSSKEPQLCDTFNGNVVLVPRDVSKVIGNISFEYSKQHNGDFDYGLRAKYAGFKTWVAPGIIGTCLSNPIKNTIFDKDLSVKERIRKMNTPGGVPPAKEWMVFAKRHAGFLWPLFWFKTMVRVVFPWSYLLLRRPHK